MIQFNHNVNTFQGSVSYGGKTLKEHFKALPEFMIDDAMDKIGEKLDKQKMSLIATVKVIDAEIPNVSLFITCCYLFARTILACSPIIKVMIANQMRPSMKGEMELSSLLESFYIVLAKDEENKENERLLLGLTIFHAGFIGAILDEYEEFEKTVKRDNLDSLLEELAKVLKPKSDTKNHPNIDKLKDLDSPEKKN